MNPAQLEPEELAVGLRVARRLRVAVFVVACRAGAHVAETLRRLPAELVPLLAGVYVIDEAGSTLTRERVVELRRTIPSLEWFHTPWELGYGGNQKLGLRYARERGFDVVCLLHGDGRYAPEVLPRLLAPFEREATAAVFGSRWIGPGAGRGMPLAKRLGSRLITAASNRMLGADLSEYQSGYRVYRVSALAELPLESNTDGFAFDTELTVQLLQRGRRPVEVPIPGYHGAEIGLWSGLVHAARCLATVAHSRAMRVHLAYHPKYDVERDGATYTYKRAPTSLHQHVLRREVPRGARVVELGAGQGDVGEHLARRGARVVAADLRRPQREFAHPFLELDLDGDFAGPLCEALDGRADQVVALDVIEHLANPERGVAGIQDLLRPGGVLFASTGNIAFLPLRLTLLLGRFNYGKKGILDLTHSRLFTVSSFRRLLERGGFRVRRVHGFGPPIQDMVGDAWYWIALDRLASLLARARPSVFGYQFAFEAERLDDVADLLERTLESGRDWVLPREETMRGEAAQPPAPAPREGVRT
jgi:2-polyprenyl-3-methyl-5-hydroxy-6-metoxy-1,4-benzoquinol methylase